MVQFAQAMAAKEIVLFNMGVSFKKLMDSDKLRAIDHFNKQRKSVSGATGMMVMERCWWLVEEGPVVVEQITGSQ